MDEVKSRVYAVVDEAGRIVQIEGEYSLSNIADLSTAVLVEEGEPCDRLNHAQNMYLDDRLLTEDGIPRYKWEDGQVVPRTGEEIAADRAAIPEPPPTAMERMEAQMTYTAMKTGTLLEEG